MKCAVVSISELQEDNPTMCLSAKRVTNQCHTCYKFHNYYNSSDSVQQTIKKLPCNPKLNKDIILALDEKKTLIRYYRKQLSNINKRLQ